MAEQPVLVMQGITKVFPGVRALDGVDFDLYPGEIHALLGENGAGKSTLVKIIGGSLKMDSGMVFFNGRKADLDTPAKAHNLGISMVYQELSLVPDLSVAENIFLGRWPRRRGRVDWGRLYEQAGLELRKLGLNVDPKAQVRSLSVAEQQLTEIAKAASRKVSIVLLDEPTSALSDNERERLFALIGALARDGIAVLYISHRLSEVLEIADRITVLRDGRKVDTVPAREVGEHELVGLMVGRSIAEHVPKAEAEIGAPILHVEKLNVPGILRDVTFDVRQGEIVGLFGLMGSGRTTLARALFGLERVTAGEIRIRGKRVKIASPRDAIRLGLGYLSEDRRQSLVQYLSISPNVTLSSLGSFSRFGVLRHKLEERAAGDFVENLRIRTPSLRQQVSRLSGGNQQKVVVSKWMCRRSSMLIFDEPTRGIDVVAKTEVFQLMGRLAQEGIGILMISSELPELLRTCDRILVMYQGSLVEEFPASKATQEELLKRANGLGG